eukprot:TRINITY_DN14865_c0_g1_i3.p1 TRINITY_DN14865_c0_g1~~TRINITY_DN14865_c0_g1_i3.p1  ORF type:complete len:117 (+),score=14.01 TRINITY_DN14865_c0_g1_i3:301-651(+)
MYDRARRAQTGQSPDAEAMRRARRQAEEDLRARAQAHMNAGFNRNRYQHSLMESLFRFLPLLVPVWMVVLLVSWHRRNRAVESVPADVVFYDNFGRAFLRDAYGRQHRMPDFDRLT